MSVQVGLPYTPVPYTRLPNASALPESRQYRAVVVECATDVLLEVEYFDSYASAHRFTLDCDSLYNYPLDEYWVERSVDSGVTWHVYNAEEFVGGRPAWVELREVE